MTPEQWAELNAQAEVWADMFESDEVLTWPEATGHERPEMGLPRIAYRLRMAESDHADRDAAERALTAAVAHARGAGMASDAIGGYIGMSGDEALRKYVTVATDERAPLVE